MGNVSTTGQLLWMGAKPYPQNSRHGDIKMTEYELTLKQGKTIVDIRVNLDETETDSESTRTMETSGGINPPGVPAKNKETKT